jgi:hypothetical protein
MEAHPVAIEVYKSLVARPWDVDSHLDPWGLIPEPWRLTLVPWRLTPVVRDSAEFSNKRNCPKDPSLRQRGSP